jgi:hypothetical protein
MSHLSNEMRHTTRIPLVLFNMNPSCNKSSRLCLLKLFNSRPRIYIKDAVMKALLTSRPEVRWTALAIPLLFVAHWLLSGIWIELVRLIPDSVRAIFHLL